MVIGLLLHEHMKAFGPRPCISLNPVFRCSRPVERDGRPGEPRSGLTRGACLSIAWRRRPDQNGGTGSRQRTGTTTLFHQQFTQWTTLGGSVTLTIGRMGCSATRPVPSWYAHVCAPPPPSTRAQLGLAVTSRRQKLL